MKEIGPVTTKLYIMCDECLTFFPIDREDEVKIVAHAEIQCGNCNRVMPVPHEIDDYTYVTNEEVDEYWENLTKQEGKEG